MSPDAIPVAARRAAVAIVALAALAGVLLGEFWLFVTTLAIIYSLAALSLVVLTGWSGQLNLHVAALGLGWGAYAAYALVTLGVPPIWALLGAGATTVPFAGMVAFAAVRFRGLELAVATLAMGAIFERLFFRNLGKALTQRATGTPFESSFVTMPRPTAGSVSFDGDRAFYSFALVVGLILFVVVINLGRASTGRTLRAIREREVMAETVGVPVIRHRIGAFVLSIVLASTAGALFASWKLAIAPDSFNLDLSFQLLAATVIGGIRSPFGAIIGGGLVALLPELVRSGPLSIFGGERLFVLFGVGMVLVLWRLPLGAVSLGEVLRNRRAGPAREVPETSALVGTGNGLVGSAQVVRRHYTSKLDRQRRPTLLRVDGVEVAFGGVRALDGVSMRVLEDEICALIGPNGAGKSTLFNSISGLVTPDAGSVYFSGGDVTELAPHRRSALGIGRTFQTVEVFRDLTVTENLMVAAHRLRTAGPFEEALALPSSRRSEARLRERSAEILDSLGLTAVADRRPGELPLGLLRVLEVGMAMIAQPKLLLLDEPSAGLDAAETAALAALVARVRAAHGLSVLLVEHDMSMVSSLAEHVYVLDFGRIISEGTPEQVRRDPVVLEKYLGEAGVTGDLEDAIGALT